MVILKVLARSKNHMILSTDSGIVLKCDSELTQCSSKWDALKKVEDAQEKNILLKQMEASNV